MIKFDNFSTAHQKKIVEFINSVNDSFNSPKKLTDAFFVQTINVPPSNPETNCYIASANHDIFGFLQIVEEPPVKRIVGLQTIREGGDFAEIFQNFMAIAVKHGTLSNAKVIHFQISQNDHESKKILDIKADIGFAFDGDGDRIIVVDEKGKQIDGDKIIALFAKHYLKSKQLDKKVIVATVMSNLGLENYLKKLGIKLVRTNVGDFNVITEMKKHSYVLGGEQSGHIILGNYLNTGDGILAAVKIIEIISSEKTKASKIFSLYDQYPQIKTNLPIKKKPNGYFDKPHVLVFLLPGEHSRAITDESTCCNTRPIGLTFSLGRMANAAAPIPAHGGEGLNTPS